MIFYFLPKGQKGHQSWPETMKSKSCNIYCIYLTNTEQEAIVEERKVVGTDSVALKIIFKNLYVVVVVNSPQKTGIPSELVKN